MKRVKARKDAVSGRSNKGVEDWLRGLKNCAVMGVFWGAWVRHAPAEYKAALAELAHWCAQGKLSCHIQEVFPLADTPKAIKALADRKVMGKLVVHPGD